MHILVIAEVLLCLLTASLMFFVRKEYVLWALLGFTLSVGALLLTIQLSGALE
jgi:hypothetical protein